MLSGSYLRPKNKNIVEKLMIICAREIAADNDDANNSIFSNRNNNQCPLSYREITNEPRKLR